MNVVRPVVRSESSQRWRHGSGGWPLRMESFFVLIVVVATILAEVESPVGAETLARAACLLFHTRPTELGLVRAVDTLATIWPEAVAASSTSRRAYPLAHSLIILVHSMWPFCPGGVRCPSVQNVAAAEHEEGACGGLAVR